jgi:prepilin-type N-terminal cleavage/methylation domain-containing protein
MKNIFCKKNTLKAFSLIEISMVILIVGILISGISKSIDLYEDFILQNARKITKNSIVPRIEGLGLWLETTLDESFNSDFKRQDGSNFLPWKSNALSGFRIPISNGGPAFYYNKKINFLPSVSVTNGGYFRGYITSDNITSESLVSNDGVTIFTVFVCYVGNYPGTCGTMFAVESPDSTYRYGISHMWGNLSFWIGNSSNLNSIDYGYVDKNMSNPHIFGARANTSKAILSIDGSRVATSDVLQSMTPSNKVYVKIGYSTGGSWSYRFMQGAVGEIIIYGRPLTNKEFRSVEEYLSKKWRIPLNNI